MVLTITNHIEQVSLPPDTRAHTDVVVRIHAPRPVTPVPQPARTLTLAIAAAGLRAPDRVAVGSAVMSALGQLGPDDEARLCLFGEGAVMTPIDLHRTDTPHRVAQLLHTLPSCGQTRSAACLDALAQPVAGPHTLVLFGRTDALTVLTQDVARFGTALGASGDAHLVHVGPRLGPALPAAPSQARSWALSSPQEAGALMAEVFGRGSFRAGGALQLRLAPQDGVEIDPGAYGHDCRFTAGAVVIPLNPLRGDAPVDIAVRVQTRTPREPGFQRLFHARLVDADQNAGAALAESDVQVLIASQTVRAAPDVAPDLWLLRTRRAREEAALLAARGERDAAQACLRPCVAAYTALRSTGAPNPAPAFEMEYALLLTDVLRGSTLTPHKRPGTPALAIPVSPGPNATRRSQAAEPPAGAHLTFEGSLLVGIYELATHTRIGRDVGNDIVVESSRISRRHTDIVRTDGGFVIEDRGSSNGTFVNGRRVAQRLPLQDGDIIVFSHGADTRVTFHASTDEKLRRPTREFPMAAPRLGSDAPTAAA